MIEGAAGCSRYSSSVEALARTGRASLPAKVGISQQDNKLLWCSLFFLGFRGLQILKFWLSCSLPAKVGIPQQDNKLLWCFFFSVFLDSEGSRYQHSGWAAACQPKWGSLSRTISWITYFLHIFLPFLPKFRL